MEANIPLGRLRIGSASNSINPETGMAEFDAQHITGEPMEEMVVMGRAQPNNLLNSVGGLGNASTAGNPTPSGTQSDPFDRILSNMSKTELMALKAQLERVSTATEVFTVAMGPLVLLINPGSPWIIATGLGLAGFKILADVLVSKIDSYINRRFPE
jgi:hypothetical protein